MRIDWPDSLSRDARRDVVLLRHPTAGWADVSAGRAADAEDLSLAVTRLTQKEREATVSLQWPSEWQGAEQPGPGDLLEIVEGGRSLWVGCVESVSEYRSERGALTLTLTVRSRDTLSSWRNVRWTSDVYPIGTDLAEVARDVLQALGFTPAEIPLKPSGRFTPHINTQLSDMTAAEMLEVIGTPLLSEPATDALGRFRWRSRDVLRESTVKLTADQVVRVRGGKRRPPLTSLALKWLNPVLEKSIQQEQVLATETITAGFFKANMGKDVFFSDDHRHRAEGTRLEIQESMNSGFIPFATEAYEQVDDFHGRLSIQNQYYVTGLATASLAAIIVASQIGDEVVAYGAGWTVPVGTRIGFAGSVGVMLAQMCMGTGVYEVRGRPFDFVHAVNTTEAFNDGASVWERREEELKSDYIANEAHAQSVAVGELVYRSLEGTSWGVDIVDHPGLESGDILELPDGARIYVQDFSRDLTRGAEAILSVEGFRV